MGDAHLSVSFAMLLLVEHFVVLAGYDGSTASTWAKNVHIWGDWLSAHKQHKEYVKAVQAMSAMLKEALGKTPNIPKFCAAAATYHHTMLTQFPKVTLRIYDHALLVHVPELLEHGSLLDGSSWFLEAFNRLWKKRLTQHSNHGGGRKTKEQEEVAELAKHSAAGKKLYHAMKANKLDRQALQALWITSKPEFRGLASKWERSGVLEAINT